MHMIFRRAVMACAGVAFAFSAMVAIQFSEQIAPRVERLAEHLPPAARTEVLMRMSAIAALFWR